MTAFGGMALVTGAGDGIGKMLAKGFAGLGMTVCVQDIREDAAARVASEIGGGAFPLVFDVSDRDATFAAAEDLKARGEELNLLWINAGVGIGAPLIGARPNLVEWAFSVNVMGAIWTAQAFGPLLQQATGFRHAGVTASSAALRPPDGDFPLYATTKHATLAVAETLRGELARDGIGTTILGPGLLNTEIWDAARARPDRFGGARNRDPEIASRWREAKSPDLMWPHIVRTIEAGGGYLSCPTDGGETARIFRERADAIAAGIVDI